MTAVATALGPGRPIRALVDSGKLKILAATSAAKSELHPTVPSMTDAGLQGIDVATWVGLAAPAATAADVTDRIAGEINKALGEDALRASMLHRPASKSCRCRSRASPGWSRTSAPAGRR